MADPVRDYAERVCSGDIVAGRLVRLACRRHLDDLRRSRTQAFPYRYDAGLAEAAFETFGLFCHTKGEWAGRPVTLEPWQQFIIGSLFGWVRKSDGLRRFRYCHDEVARKNGKSLVGSGIGLTLAFFDGEEGAEVYAAATKRDQAKIVWGEAARIVKLRASLRKHLEVWRASSTISCEMSNAKFLPLGADSDTMDGLNVHGAIIDELHAHRTPEVLEVLETATGARRQPLICIITTAGAGQESVWWQRRKLAIDVLEKTIEDETLFAYIATLDDEDDWRDRSVWIKANPNLGVSVKMDDLEMKARRAEHSSISRAAFLRLHLNRPTNAIETWLDLDRWDACPDRKPELELVGKVAFGGLDLSSKVDLTALLLAIPAADGSYDLIDRFWVPADTIEHRSREDRVPYDLWVEQGWIRKTPGNVIDYSFIEHEILELGKHFDVQEVAFDPWSATQTATRLQDEGVTMVEMRQGYKSLSEPTKEWEKLILEGKLRHSGSPVLRWMVANAAVDMDPAGNVKPSKKQTRARADTARIDGVVAGIMAIGRAMLPREQSPYRDRGVRSV